MYTIAMAIPALGGFYFSGLFRAVQCQAVQAGVHLIALRTGSRQMYDLPFALDQADAWILALDATSDAFCTALCDSGKPVVSIAHKYADSRVTEIRTDNRAGTRDAMQALYGAGHRRFGFLGHVADSDSRERLDAFYEFLAEQDISCDPAAVVSSDATTLDAGRLAAKAFLHMPKRPTAVITSNDQNAAGAVDCFLRGGLRVPQDIAVVGFENSPLSRSLRPAIASIDLNFDALARTAFFTLLDRLSGSIMRPPILIVPSTFIPRDSAGVLASGPAVADSDTVPLDQFADMIMTSDEISPFLHSGAMAEVPSLLRQVAENARWAVFARPTPDGGGLVLMHGIDEGGELQKPDTSAIDSRRFPLIGGAHGFRAIQSDFIATLPLWVDGALCGVIALCLPEEALASDVTRHMLVHNLELTATGLERAIQSERLETRVNERTRELLSVNAELGEALQTLSATQADLVQAEKMAALGILVAGVAHEMNTPIGNGLLVSTSIHNEVMELGALLSGGNLRRSALEERLRMLDECTVLLSRNMRVASELIASFKQVAVLQSSQRRMVFDLEETLPPALAGLRARLRVLDWPQLVFELEPGLKLDSYLDPFCQAMVSLAENAELHAFTGRKSGRITVSSRRLDGAMAELAVTDDGCGIPPENLPLVFDPFFTTRRQQGTGLGLHIAYNIVTCLLGGRLTVESEVGRGTRFVMTLPICAPEQAQPKVVRRPAAVAGAATT